MWVTDAPAAATTNSSGVAGSKVAGLQTPSALVVLVSAAPPLRSPVSGETR
jgi:hypothetical protein